MSNTSHAAGRDVHAAPTQSLAKKVVSIGVLLGVPLLVVLGLVNAYKKQDGAAPASMSEEAVMSRIQKVGRLSLGASQQALRSGEEVYKVQCTTCHAAGLLGAPKFSDATAWGPRVKLGYDNLLASALKGKGNMTPQGGGSFSDYEIGRAVVYLANAGGAKFAEPKAPADAAGPAAAQAPSSATK
ncbi:MAG: cytochrome c5 family protein [Rhodoferax sp.]|jgi:cytochrome c5|uniref:c-type cytochrome n=1 Tax=Rhodoferax sp. TaxID=50421 RepID=UPI001B710BC3|nr:c-type cytochrome [Rhodoferax sp.]MBP9735086.1 cytochrome c5 family protein [Rhodoferax sp.]